MRFAVKLRILGAVLLVACAGALAQSTASNVEDSVHNLSLSGPGTVKATTEVGVCIFCHAPHNNSGGQALWNKTVPGDTYQAYNSTTFPQTTNPISERSKLCLSCHDGTVALGQTVATGDLGVASKMTGKNNLGTDLRRDHPISFTLPAVDDGEIQQWLRTAPITSPDTTIHIYNNRIECSTCHDPHVQNKDQVAQKFLVRSNDSGAICLNCHDATRGDIAGYNLGQHATASNYNVNASAGMSYSTVASNACLTCHTSHNSAGTGPRLLRGVEEATCFTCHSSSSATTPASTDIMTSVTNAQYKHPIISVAGVHDTGETLPVSSARHSECEDCHNPHAAKGGASAVTAPLLQPSLTGAKGVSAIDNSVMAPARNEYEVCLKCHGASTNKPQKKGFDADFGRTVYRQSYLGLTDPYNTALQFRSTIASHNVMQAGINANAPSLRSNMLDINGNPTGRSLTNPQIYCTDCHNSDQNRQIGGSGPNGPHASSFAHLLERRYDTNTPGATPGGSYGLVPYTTGPNGAYAMCDKCHDVAGKVLTDYVHQKHVMTEQVACSTCHASHGIQGGDASHHGKLIDPDTSIVAPLAGTPADSYINTSTRTCNLTCHNRDHVNMHY